MAAKTIMPSLGTRREKYVKEIVKRLEKLTYDKYTYTVCRDFINFAEATLRMMPVHLRSAAAGKGLAEDPQDIQALWSELRTRYDNDDWQVLAEAFRILLDNGCDVDGSPSYDDIIGEVYMMIGVAKKNSAGQFFTPPDVGSASARMILGEENDTTALVVQRIEEALSRAGDMVEYVTKPLFTGWVRHQTKSPTTATWDIFTNHVLPVIKPHYEPVRVLDPACGSGGLLLAAARQFPLWANAFGLVQYYATDIDSLCVTMTRLNLTMYQLHGVIECRDALAPLETPSVKLTT